MNKPTASIAASEWPWPDSMDALVAAPAHHHLLFENERVRVLDTRIPAGEMVPLHTHCWPCILYLVAWDHFIRRDQQGDVLPDTRQNPRPSRLPFAIWSEPMPPHTVENVGTSEIHLIGFELKETAAAR